MTILFCGGGTLGPVTPLIAVLRRMKQMRRDLTYAWVGTPDGPEAPLITREGIAYVHLPIVKFPRYFSLAWFMLLRDYLRARKAARQILDDTRPDLVVGMGGFTQVPVMQEALRRRIPCAIHQLDAAPTLSNRLVGRRCASLTTTCDPQMFRGGKNAFARRAVRARTPNRFAGKTIPDKEAGASYFFLDPSRPIVLVTGGGTGARALNEAIETLRHRLPQDIQILHATGKGKGQEFSDPKYLAREFLDEQDLFFAYAAADVVVSRAGMGALADIATLSKSAIIIPIPGSQQEANAEALREGIELVKQNGEFDLRLERAITSSLAEPARLARGAMLHCLLPTDDGSELAERWIKLLPGA